MRITEWADKLNVQILQAKVAPGKPVYRLCDFFTTRDGSWEVKPGVEYGIPQWARDTYLRPWGAPDYFDDAGADHHIFGAVVGATKVPDKAGQIFYRTWTDNGNHTVQSVKPKSGWANIIMTGKYFPDQGQVGPYEWQPFGVVPGDAVRGAGMPYNLHVSFFATWQLVTEPATEQPPTDDARIVKLETWARAISAKYPGGPQYDV